MKSRQFRQGKHTYRAYCKPVGKGYEVGLTFGGNPLFLGNFIHSKEANSWYTQMNKEITKFSTKFWITSKAPKSFYKKFLANHLYKTYYAWLGRQMPKYANQFTRAYNKDVRKYKQLKKNWKPQEKVALRRAA